MLDFSGDRKNIEACKNPSSARKENGQQTQLMYHAEHRTETQDTLVRSKCPAVNTLSSCSGKVPLKTTLIQTFHRANTKGFNCLFKFLIAQIMEKMFA